MAKKDKRITDYINRSADFAKPVLTHFRELVHTTCPDVEEAVKWGFPHFDYLGGPMCSMASFKQHCAIGFWKAALMKDAKVLLATAKTETAMGHFGKITSLKDLPKDSKMASYIKDAMRLNNEGLKLPVKNKSSEKKEIPVPDYFSEALSKNLKAQKVFSEFAPSHRKEYLEWITGAKTDETRLKRMNTAIEWMSEGKGRNWKYKNKS